MEPDLEDSHRDQEPGSLPIGGRPQHEPLPGHQRQIDAEIARRDAEEAEWLAEHGEEDARRILDRWWADWKPALVVVLVVIGLIVIVPVGPDVTGDQMERSLAAVAERDAPPSADDSPFASMSCIHPITNTWKFTCTGNADIALLPDVEVRYDVRVEGDRCWTATRKDSGGAREGLYSARLRGCIRR